MGKSNTEQLKIAQKYLGQGGSKFRSYCGLPSGSAWCDAFVTYIFNEAGNASLFCNGTKQTYCPTTIKWCNSNLAQIPPYLALPSDIIFFDWELNGVPNHIGFVRERKSCNDIYTIEGNTSNSIVANKTRAYKYVQGIYRPHFKASFTIGKIAVDGYFGYNSIANLQKALGGLTVDGILGKATVKKLQAKVGVTQDGSWGKGTSKAVQKMLGVTQDGLFGTASVKALQTWINKQNGHSSTPTPTPTLADKIMSACKTQAEWMKNYTYDWGKWKPRTVEMSKKYGTCVTYVACVLQRLGYLKSGEHIWQNGKGYGTGKVYGTNSKMTVTYMNNKTFTACKSQLKAGDIVMVDDNKSGKAGNGGHIMIFSGKWTSDGKPYVWDNNSCTRTKKGYSQPMTAYGKTRKILAIVRLK